MIRTFMKIKQSLVYHQLLTNKTIKQYRTFDTDVSEHITDNINILSNFKEENLTLKCANNSLCKFEGIDTFEGSIKWFWHQIKKNVLYSKDINKNLLNGIKLSKKKKKKKILVTINDMTEVICSPKRPFSYLFII